MSALEVSKHISVPSCGRDTKKESQGEQGGAPAGGKGWAGRGRLRGEGEALCPLADCIPALYQV